MANVHPIFPHPRRHDQCSASGALAVDGNAQNRYTTHAPPMTAQIRVFLIPFVTFCFIFGSAAAIIAYGRGYRISHDGTIKPTGLMVVQSDPSGAQIIIDDTVKTATQATLTLPPGFYNVTVAKDGFQSWSKRMKVQGEVVAKVEALLLPTNPSLTAITTSGVVNPALSPDGSKLAYIIPKSPAATPSSLLAATKPGIWVLDLIDKPLGLNRDARQIAQSGAIDFSNATLQWSPDNEELLVTLSPTAHYRINLSQSDTIVTPVENIKLLQSEWKQIKEQRQSEQFLTVPKRFTDMATASAKLLAFSPDETKILYEATAAASLPPIIVPPVIGANPTPETRTITAGTIYVYDIKEDRNYLISPSPTASRGGQTPQSSLHWLPSSRHLLIATGGKIEIMDYDGTNRRTAYAGPFWDSFAVPWASGGKIVILTNLNSPASAVNNLYVVNLK